MRQNDDFTSNVDIDEEEVDVVRNIEILASNLVHR